METKIIIFIILIALVLYFLFLKRKISPSMTLKKSSKLDYLNGEYDIYCKADNQKILPFMFNNLSKDYISNDNCKWNFMSHDKMRNRYKIYHKLKPVCIYINNDKVCLYPIQNNNLIQNNDSDCHKPTLCSTDNFMEQIPEYKEDDSIFEIQKIDNNLFTIKKNNLYLCKNNNNLSLSSTLNDNCIFILS